MVALTSKCHILSMVFISKMEHKEILESVDEYLIINIQYLYNFEMSGDLQAWCLNFMCLDGYLGNSPLVVGLNSILKVQGSIRDNKACTMFVVWMILGP